MNDENNEKLEVRNEEWAEHDSLYSLIPFDEFKSLIGIDDRDDKTARFCLVTASLRIEQYCKRKFLRKQYKETFQLNGGLSVILSEYPVSEIIQISCEQLTVNNEMLIIFGSKTLYR